MTIGLGLESSCDETAAAVVENGRTVLSNIISSQIDLHREYYGVVPEIASRAHLETINILIERSLRGAGKTFADLDYVAATSRPGLVGSLLIALQSAKVISYALKVPLVAVNHLEAHLYAPFLEGREPAFPYIGLLVSGGNTALYLVGGTGDMEVIGRTVDDAAGEAYDKTAKVLGLPYPGGPEVDRLAAGGNPGAFDFPVPLKGSSEIAFSFSGLKTAAVTEINRLAAAGGPLPVADICASFQRAAVDSLVGKLALAVKKTGVKTVAVSGGVAANSALRAALRAKKGWKVFLPPPNRCTDNAVMIAAAGYNAFVRGERSSLSFSPDPSWEPW